MKRLLYFVIVLMFMIITTGCSNSTTGDEKIAVEFVQSHGYKITAQKGLIHEYILEKNKLWGTENLPYIQAWSVQNVEPDKYFGKEITVYCFTVTNHPLEKIYKQVQGVNVYVMLSEENVIGGYSYPNAKFVGAFSSLEGKTLGEVTGLTFKEWSESWKKKYGD